MKRKIITAMLLVCAGLLSLALREPEEFTRSTMSMNTIIRMTVYDNEKVLDEAFGLLDDLDRKLSMYNPSSDISRINANSGHDVDAHTLNVVKDALRLHEITGGVFNPLIGAVTRLWKINQADGKMPSPESLDNAVKLADIKNLSVSGDKVYLREKGCVLDLGGIAKGYASTAISKLMKDRGVKSAIIDLGGNVHTVGSKPDGSAWRIGVRNPLKPMGTPALIADIRDCAVITSGNYERFKTIDGKKYSHFFNPVTGESVNSELLSVTVISPDGSLADGLATAFMITGVDKALEILGNMAEPPGVIFITQEGIIATENLRPVITKSLIPVTFASGWKAP
ncbi:MAG: FAD:protein FMN transferase [Synergistaceae bacterium]|nr:FAD:protein FMN transferase [Synergistaceae bacterium]MBQ3760013.1 FAD:protein FMN transferase [Synergistaceae bacterium]MBQ6114104.1 FAD:protein FMN transferase [Synergistaceae bacterium]